MDMIRTLHRKFLLVALAAVTIIIVMAVGLINGTLYVRVHHEISTVMTIISSHGGALPKSIPMKQRGAFEMGNWAEETPEFTYQARYFSVIFDQDSETAKVINVSHIAAFDEAGARSLAQDTLRRGKESGTFLKAQGYYAYEVTALPDGDVLVVILDCTRDMLALSSILTYSLALGLSCLLIFFVIVTLLSGKVMAPFIRNMENQKRFITNAGHELKTPVAIISANAEAMELIGGKSEWTGNILKQTKRLSGLIGDLVAMAKIGEIEKKDLILADIDISKTVEAAAGDFSEMAAAQGKQMKQTIATGIHGKTDKKLLTELIGILLDNSVKYCDEGGTITVALSETRKGASLSVINPYAEGKHEDYEKFFERFYRSDISHSTAIKGYGIGLSMAADITRLLDASIHVGWKDGDITFTVDFKIK